MKKIIFVFLLSFFLTGCSIMTKSAPTNSKSINQTSETEKACAEYAQGEKNLAKKFDDYAISQGVNLPRADYKKIYNDAYRECILMKTTKVNMPQMRY